MVRVILRDRVTTSLPISAVAHRSHHAATALTSTLARVTIDPVSGWRWTAIWYGRLCTQPQAHLSLNNPTLSVKSARLLQKAKLTASVPVPVTAHSVAVPISDTRFR